LELAEYKLNAEVFKALESKFCPFGLDACAASWNAQLPRYLSRQKGYRAALGHDVLSYPLQRETQRVWLFFPPHQQLVVEILQRVSGAGVDASILMSA